MTPPVYNGGGASGSGASPPPAGTGRPESNAPEGFDGEQFGALAKPDAANGDGVQHRCEVCDREAGHDGPHERTFAAFPASPGWTGSPEQVAAWNEAVRRGNAITISGLADPRDGLRGWTEAERVAFLRRAQQEGRQ